MAVRPPYTIRFTHAAKVTAALRGIELSQLEAFIREAMRQDGYHEGEDADCYPPELIFHVVDYDQPQCWVISGDGEAGVSVDSGKYVDTGTTMDRDDIPEALRGKKIQMPRGDSDEDEVL